MAVISAVAAALLTIAGYSTGAVLAGKAKDVHPKLLDVFLVPLLCALAVIIRSGGGWWPIVMAAIGGGLVGATVTAIVYRVKPDHSRYVTPVPRRHLSFVNRVGEKWQWLAKALGNYQGRMLMSIVYFLLVAPFAIILRMTDDPLHVRLPANKTMWPEHSSGVVSLEQARSGSR